jgi:hypothetical protein
MTMFEASSFPVLFFALWLSGMGAGWSFHIYLKGVRKRKIKKIAAARGWSFIGNRVPSEIAVEWISLGKKNYWVSNCIVGELEDVACAVFDLAYSRGKTSSSQTIVALQKGTGNDAAPVDSIAAYRFEAAAGWLFAWVPEKIVPAEQLEDWCSEMNVLSERLMRDPEGVRAFSESLFRQG